MKLSALCPLVVSGVKVAPGEHFEATEASAEKLIARKQASPAPKKRAKKAPAPKE